MKRIFSRAICPLFFFFVLNNPADALQVQNVHQSYPCVSPENPGVVAIASEQVCGKITRKLDIADEKSSSIDIHYIKLPATGTAKREPVVFIQGGPGGEGLPLAGPMKWGFRKLNIDRDFIFVDLRGVGKSNALNCEGDLGGVMRAQAMDVTEQLVVSCMQKFSAIAPFFTTPIFVDDLEALREELNYSAWSIWSVSYGGRVALDYMARYPKAIASVVLDSPAPITVGLPSQVAQNLEIQLNALSTQCEADESCRKTFGNPWKNALAVKRRLDATPENITEKNKITQEENHYHISSFSFANSINQFFYSRLSYSQLPEALHKATLGDWSIFIAMEKAMRKQMSVAYGLHLVVACNEDRNFWPEKMQNFLGNNLAHFYQIACNELPKAATSVVKNLTIESTIPTLILSGENDVVTPTAVAKSIHNHLKKSQFIKVKNGVHSVSFEGCIPDLITQFYINPHQPLDTLECEKRISAKPLYKGGNAALGVDTGMSDD